MSLPNSLRALGSQMLDFSLQLLPLAKETLRAMVSAA